MDKSSLAKSAVARAALAAELLRPNLSTPPVRPEALRELHSAIDAAIYQCSPGNIQRARRIVIQTMASTPARITALGKYLCSLSPTTRTRHARTYILYLLSDILHHSRSSDTFKSGMMPFLPLLVAHAWSYHRTRAAVEDLVALWEETGYFHSLYAESLIDQATIEQLLLPSSSSATAISSHHRDVALDSSAQQTAEAEAVPAVLGDEAAAYYDLPASTMLDFVNPSDPIIPPDKIGPVKLHLDPSGTKFPQHVLDAVDRFYRALERSNGRFREPDEDASDGGDEEDEFMYEGWTIKFYDQIKQESERVARAREERQARGRRGRLSPYNANDDDSRRSRSYSPYTPRSASRSRSRSPSPRLASRFHDHERVDNIRSDDHEAPQQFYHQFYHPPSAPTIPPPPPPNFLPPPSQNPPWMRR
ncbi:hypothetical protein BZA70DRAFT_275425 [Myxozyma melibiosi]|uniref:CID domain-containing protein n=1 Tax=Myxozyma melibiosi TaxID=54550 RepID=A0ABR1FAR8_9ASCO